MPRGAVLLARHAERVDYTESDKRGWVAAAARPWDSPITESGREQARRLGKRIADGCKEGGEFSTVPKPTVVYSSPFIRAVQTAVEAAKELGIAEVRIEEGLSECLCEDWYKSWALPTSDSTWGGPPGVDQSCPDSEVKPEASDPGVLCIRSAAELSEVVPQVRADHGSVTQLRGRGLAWRNWESHESVAERGARTVRTRQAEHPDESALYVSHGAPTFLIPGPLTGRQGEPGCGYCALYVLTPTEKEMFEPHAAAFGCTAHL
eukprot:TRINITY_DN9262_c0_g1_i4.p1 TRINITY_DN9262_c0_g1~~TRINITY_DN9262_c0_g1_i4.p1  ORF type:complete len:280 (+),score=70.79 TRINITY_DN9262_c0_g1_i4:52-840(+)